MGKQYYVYILASRKKWRRAWKMELIEKDNPGWADFYPDIAGTA